VLTFVEVAQVASFTGPKPLAKNCPAAASKNFEIYATSTDIIKSLHRGDNGQEKKKDV
jgi:hypothetical protein